MCFNLKPEILYFFFKTALQVTKRKTIGDKIEMIVGEQDQCNIQSKVEVNIKDLLCKRAKKHRCSHTKSGISVSVSDVLKIFVILILILLRVL